MQTKPGAIDRYWRLAVETSAYQHRLKAAGIWKYPTWIDVEESHRVTYLVSQIPEEHHDVELFSRWDEWAAEYEEIHRSSPKWRLKEMISSVSETHAFVSWPRRWEQEIWKWAMAEEEPARCPFDDRRSYLDPGFRQRLRTLIEEAGGFLYRCEESGQIVFVPSAELPKIWRHQDHLSEIDRNKRFGFFYDASRPNSKMRAPTEQEEQIMAFVRRRGARKAGWRARVIRSLKKLAR